MSKASRKSRSVSRKNRKASRKASRKNRKASRKNGGSRRGIFETVYSPVGHLIHAAEESVGAVTNTTRNIIKTGLKGVNSIGKSVTGHANSAIRNVVSRKSRKNRKNRRN